MRAQALEALEEALVGLWELTDEQRAASAIYLGTEFDEDKGTFKRVDQRPKGSETPQSLVDLAIANYRTNTAAKGTNEHEGYVFSIMPINGVDSELKEYQQGVLAVARPIEVPFVESEDVFLKKTAKAIGGALSHCDMAESSNRDGLVQSVFPRRRYDEHLKDYIQRQYQSYQEQLSLIFLDIDHFKHLNDEHGHLVGDRALVEFGKMLKDRGGSVYRYGGEEFVIMLKHDLAYAAQVAEEIRAEVEEKVFDLGLPPRRQHMITISAGVAEFTGAESPDALTKRADDAMYAAKQAGRNRVYVDVVDAGKSNLVPYSEFRGMEHQK